MKLLYVQEHAGMSMVKEVLSTFLNLEKRNHVKKHIRKLLISGAITTDPYSILSEQNNFITTCTKQKRQTLIV